ncbi:hypothetical protein Tco_0087497 [Tanacetum coccineum]
MAALESCPKHNMVAYLEKTEQNAQFHEIVDFPTRSSIYYSLTVSPVVSTSLIEQFWNTATSKTVNNVSYIKAKVAGKAVSISEASIRRDLLFNDEDGIGCLANSEIYENLQLIGNLDAKKKFLMYPRFVQVFLNNHLSNLPVSLDNFPIPVLTKKVFTNMAKKGLHFSGHVTPLFPNMLTQAVVDEGEGSEKPTEPQPTSSPTQPSTGDQPPMTESSSGHNTNQYLRVNLEGTGGSEGDQVQIPHDSPLSGGQTSDRAEGALNLDELFVLCTNLSNRVLALETFKDAQAAEILTLKSRIKKLEKKREEMAKPGPSLDDSTFDDLDVDLAHGMDYMETKEAVDEGRTSSKTKELNVTHDAVIIEKKGSAEKGGSTEDPVSTVVPEFSTVNVSTASRQEVSTATPMTPPTTTSVFEDEDIFLADALVMLSDKTKLKGVAIKEVEESDRLARLILTLKPLPTIDPKDKGKGVLEEPEPAKKMTKSDFDAAHVARDEEVARQLEVEWQAEVKRERQRQEQASIDYIANLYDELQARIDADHELAVRWTHEEQEKYIVDERAKLLAEFFERRKKQLAEERAATIRNKPPTRTQLRSGVYDEKVIEEPASTKIENINKTSEGESSDKGKKTDADLEEEEQLKAFLNIVSDEEGVVDYEVLDKRYPIVNWESKFYHTDRYGEPHDYYRVFRADGSSRYIKTFTEMVSRFDRLDFIELHSLVMQRFATITPEGIDLVLWGDLRTMFEENADDDLWKNQEKWILKSWNFYENCGVHVLVLEDGTEFYMLAERRYPLTKETLERMLALRLIVDSESEAVFDLLRFIQKQIDEFGSHDGSEKDL